MQRWRLIMTWLSRPSRQQQDNDLDRELSTHLELEAEEQRDAGLATEDARYAAQRAFGNTALVKEDTRAVWGWTAVERLQQDLRYAARTLRKSPGFASVILSILALGIGANTTIFSIVNGVLLRPLPFSDPDRLMMLEEKWLPRFPRFELTPQDFLAWQRENRTFSEMAAFNDMAFDLTAAERPERISGARVSANLPALLGVEPILGRSFRPEEDQDGNDRVVLLGHGLWHRRYGANPRVVGRAVSLDGISFTIVGVMPADFRFPRDAEIWKPMGFTSEELRTGSHWVWGVGRLKPAVTREQAQADLDLLMRESENWKAQAVPLMDHYVGSVRTALWVLLGAAGFVLLIACVNVAGLLLARAAVRQKEISLRAAIGASRARIVQQLLTETMLLALLGGLLGVVLALGGLSIVRGLPLEGIPRLDEIALDYPVLLYTLGLSTLTGLLFGLSPAVRLSRTDLQEALKAGGRTSGAGVRTGARNALVVSEVAIALVLLAGAGLLLKSFWRLLEVRPGFNPESVLAATINLPTVNYGEPYQQNQFAEELLQRIRGLPEVRAVAVSTDLPFSGITDVGIHFEGRPAGPLWGTTANYYGVTPLYLQAMRIPLMRGRFFTERDTPASQPVVIINETMARRFFPNEDPLGKQLDISGPTYMREIVGVVGDVKQEGFRRETAPQVYEPFLQQPRGAFKVVVRGVGDSAHLADAVRHAVSAIDGNQPISDVATMEGIVAGSVSHDRFSALLLGLFGLLALVLAAVGIYGVTAYSVAQRAHEIGVRIALGAHQRRILQLVLGQSLRSLLLGLVIGVAGSLALTGVLGSLLYEVEPRDPATLVAVSVLLVGVALFAVFIPARRASRVDPVVALRSE
ncbi:MAG: FtsX-like permease family protein [Luteitalea sp.]|nr:FtsX-like permease family protein [Luteitalea sp.]